jgi:hypothetical protein
MIKRMKVVKGNSVQPWGVIASLPPVKPRMTQEEASQSFNNDPGIRWFQQQCKHSHLPNIFMLSLGYPDECGWNRFLPHMSDISVPWPGDESKDGLRKEHLSPDCKLIVFYLFLRHAIYFLADLDSRLELVSIQRSHRHPGFSPRYAA